MYFSLSSISLNFSHWYIRLQLFQWNLLRCGPLALGFLVPMYLWSPIKIPIKSDFVQFKSRQWFELQQNYTFGQFMKYNKNIFQTFQNLKGDHWKYTYLILLVLTFWRNDFALELFQLIDGTVNVNHFQKYIESPWKYMFLILLPCLSNIFLIMDAVPYNLFLETLRYWWIACENCSCC